MNIAKPLPHSRTDLSSPGKKKVAFIKEKDKNKNHLTRDPPAAPLSDAALPPNLLQPPTSSYPSTPSGQHGNRNRQIGVLISDPLFITSSTSISSAHDRSNAPPLATLDTAAIGGGERVRCRERSRSCCCFSIYPPPFAFAFSLAARLLAVAAAVAQAASSHIDEDDELDFFDTGRRLEYDLGVGAPGGGVVRVEHDGTLRFFDKTGLGGASGEVLWEWRVTNARVLFFASGEPFALFSSLVLLWARTAARLCGLVNTAVKAACGDCARAADAAA